ncbi:MAG: hypothetical protein CME59_21890 [Halioglobus sp.]|nr:hypothetical protein [Halioglobus sp.]|tara:strand:- start:2422 stop:2880 length:459 start_codon:yes stop_codon:yes gene_type:complete
MSYIDPSEKAQFFQQVDEYARSATWCALATESNGEPRVRMVHPTWEGEVLWFATGPETLKARQIALNPVVDIQYQVAPPDFIHLLVRGRATMFDDDATREHVWNNVMDYDLSQFWPQGPKDPGYIAVRVDPERVELAQMFGTANKRVWRAGA